MWRLSQTTAPAREPLTEASTLLLQHLRLDDAEAAAQADLLEMYVAASRAQCETFTSLQLIDATYKLFADSWCEDLTDPADGETVRLPKGPIDTASVVITYVDSNGTVQTLSSATYVVSQDAGPRPRRARIRPAYGYSWPTLRSESDAVRVAFDAGYGTIEADIPGPLLSGLLLVVGELYERRERATVGIVAPNLIAAENLWQPFRLF